ncbi:type III PLP-dependent enzyme [Streptomyces kaniharaensis]|uniref:Type III PLP-dependent enzyme n=1 Tax=Streptomyces kaniharaensis TaxID=212423 RepID=A0A6N7KZH9_9ACTN|nr:type III PLP-dependent enzyme [Streptomyces kaniharaensis]MQS15668.1 type III PLP-dependent enzyme [Streptomyces kaniharaensis]
MTAAVRRLVAGLASDALPAYVYDLTALRVHAAAVRAALPERAELYYAAKANPEPEILAALADLVDGYEVSSGGELAHVHQVLPQAALAFGGPGKTPAETALALRIGVGRWHLESEQELRRLAALLAGMPGRTVDVLLRLNLPAGSEALGPVALTMGGRPTPFGLDPDQAERCLRLLAAPGFEQLRLRGVHAHLASGLDAPAQLAVTERIVRRAVELAERHAFELTEVNAGGGMAVDYADPARRFDWKAFGAGLAELLERVPGLRLRIEPGRALTAYCGYYATEVLDVKQSYGQDVAVLRGGTHHLRTPATRGHDQPFTVVPVTDWPHPWARPAVTTGRATLAGQLCTPKDVLAHQAAVTVLRAADRVMFELAGAYAWNISHHDFLMHPRPAFHFLAPGELDV